MFNIFNIKEHIIHFKNTFRRKTVFDHWKLRINLRKKIDVIKDKNV